MTHASVPSEVPRKSPSTSGNATLTIVVSRKARNVASDATPNTRQGCGEEEREGTGDDPWGGRRSNGRSHCYIRANGRAIIFRDECPSSRRTPRTRRQDTPRDPRPRRADRLDRRARGALARPAGGRPRDEQERPVRALRLQGGAAAHDPAGRPAHLLRRRRRARARRAGGHRAPVGAGPGRPRLPVRRRVRRRLPVPVVLVGVRLAPRADRRSRRRDDGLVAGSADRAGAGRVRARRARRRLRPPRAGMGAARVWPRAQLGPPAQPLGRRARARADRLAHPPAGRRHGEGPARAARLSARAPAPAPNPQRRRCQPRYTGEATLSGAKMAAERHKMSKAVQEWSDARLNDLAAAIEPVPRQVAVLTEAVEHLEGVTAALQPLPSQVAALSATVERLTDENRALRDSLAAMQRQLLQVAWGLVAALLGAAAALISVLH